VTGKAMLLARLNKIPEALDRQRLSLRQPVVAKIGIAFQLKKEYSD
jgi:hypothetical protein